MGADYMIDLQQGDCLELMKNIPDGSVDLVLADPPYGVMKGIEKGKASKDIGYKPHDWDVVVNIHDMFAECSRVLRPNGKCVLFGKEPYTINIITSALPSLPFLYRAVWIKNNAANVLGCNKAMVNFFEDICIFGRIGTDKDHTNPLRKIMQKYVEKYGKEKIVELFEKEGRYTSSLSARVHASYKFGFNGGERMDLLDKKMYLYLKENGIDFIEEWGELESLYKTHEAKRSSVFNLWQGNKTKSNVLQYPKDGGGYHQTQKPVALLQDLIQTFSNPGDTVLDFTMGSGSTGVACVNTGRNFIGMELDPGYFEMAKQRIEKAVSENVSA